ncbi:hypothetical protein ABZ345_32255 [Lentzea sp. NPDC005914]|uniref:hypothetical protein n=1 Tax=Lentzea sp. NPDC005914 TaxID=3154572 RepID=UPI0033D3E139
MTRKKSSLVLLILSMVYAAVVGLLAVTDSSALTAVAIAGGALLGIGWATSGYLSNQRS